MDGKIVEDFSLHSVRAAVGLAANMKTKTYYLPLQASERVIAREGLCPMFRSANQNEGTALEKASVPSVFLLPIIFLHTLSLGAGGLGLGESCDDGPGYLIQQHCDGSDTGRTLA